MRNEKANFQSLFTFFEPLIDKDIFMNRRTQLFKNKGAKNLRIKSKNIEFHFILNLASCFLSA